MSNILVSEVSECAQYRVWSCLAETAECRCLDILSECFELVDIFELASSVCDLFKDLEHPLSTDTAWRALTARFINCEFEEELCDIYHAVIFVHYDKTA